MKQPNKKGITGVVLQATPVTPLTRKPHFDITTAQLLDNDYDKSAFLEWLGGVAESERVARIMMAVLAAPTQNTTKRPRGKIA